jgi:hypothetical protein
MSIEKIKALRAYIARREAEELDRLEQVNEAISAAVVAGSPGLVPGATEKLLSATAMRGVFQSYLNGLDTGLERGDAPELVYARMERFAVNNLAQLAAQGMGRTSSWTKDLNAHMTLKAMGEVVSFFVSGAEPIV